MTRRSQEPCDPAADAGNSMALPGEQAKRPRDYRGVSRRDQSLSLGSPCVAPTRVAMFRQISREVSVKMVFVDL
jgi:hypothetical protein